MKKRFFVLFAAACVLVLGSCSGGADVWSFSLGMLIRGEPSDIAKEEAGLGGKDLSGIIGVSGYRGWTALGNLSMVWTDQDSAGYASIKSWLTAILGAGFTVDKSKTTPEETVEIASYAGKFSCELRFTKTDTGDGSAKIPAGVIRVWFSRN